MARLFASKQINNIHDHSLRNNYRPENNKRHTQMPYIHLTATPQFKGAIPEPFTGSISYIHIIMKSKICKVDICKIEKNVTQPYCQLVFVFEGWGVGWRVEDEFIPLFFFLKKV